MRTKTTQIVIRWRYSNLKLNWITIDGIKGLLEKKNKCCQCQCLLNILNVIARGSSVTNMYFFLFWTSPFKHCLQREIHFLWFILWCVRCARKIKTKQNSVECLDFTASLNDKPHTFWKISHLFCHTAKQHSMWILETVVFIKHHINIWV